jgi:hypothetical protein
MSHDGSPALMGPELQRAEFDLEHLLVCRRSFSATLADTVGLSRKLDDGSSRDDKAAARARSAYGQIPGFRRISLVQRADWSRREAIENIEFSAAELENPSQATLA